MRKVYVFASIAVAFAAVFTALIIQYYDSQVTLESSEPSNPIDVSAKSIAFTSWELEKYREEKSQWKEGNEASCRQQ